MHEEVVHGAFTLYRDVILMTSRRYLEIDLQGLTGTKTEYLSIPWRKVVAFSVESAGIVDLDSEMKLWVSGIPGINDEARKNNCSLIRRFAGTINVIGLQRVLADHICI